MEKTFKRFNVAVGPHGLEGDLRLPEDSRGLIIFAHGSGSSRFSPRNMRVAENLCARGFATLLFDLLTEEEAQERCNVFDIALLGARLREAIAWASHIPQLCGLPIGLFGASTGAGAALVAAASESQIAAIVSRGGRPDLAGKMLGKVKAPTLLIVGGFDSEVIELNRAAQRELRCINQLHIVHGATHLFEEPGTMEQVVALASEWLLRYVQKGCGA